MISVVSDARELDEFKKQNKGNSWALAAFKNVILDQSSQESLPYRDLYYSVKASFEMLGHDREVWNNLGLQLTRCIEEQFIGSEKQIKSHTPYLIRSLILYLIQNPESDAFLRITLENFMEDEFKKLGLLAKSEILCDLLER
jgi:hypothetical protein